jgi:hypothetical protein
MIILEQKGSLEEGYHLVADAIPTDLAGDADPRLYAIVPRNGLFTKIRLDVTYIPNSRVISSLGSDIDDTRLKSLAAVTGIITAAGPKAFDRYGPPGDIPDSLPAVIDPHGAQPGIWSPLPGNESWYFRLDVDPPPKDAMKTADFIALTKAGTNVLPFSACRDATLYILRSPGTKPPEKLDDSLGEALAFSLKIGDPDYVQTVRIPVHGKIDMHPGCGANVTDEKTDSSSMWEVVAGEMRQVEAVKGTYDKLKLKQKLGR